MSLRDIEAALQGELTDDGLVRHFLSVWPVIESILEAFSRATKLPIFVYLNRRQVFQSSPETMPPFCAVMLASREMASRCVHDGQRRALLEEPEMAEGLQLCHAGMINGRFRIDTSCVGDLTILYGSRKSLSGDAAERRGRIKRNAADYDPELESRLSAADSSDVGNTSIDGSDISLMRAIATIIEKLVAATVGFRSLTINMAHELVLVMAGMGLLAKELQLSIELDRDLQEMRRIQGHVLSESQLGLYVVRNFLSHASEQRYAQVASPRFTEVNLSFLVREMVDLHEWQAAAKGLAFEVGSLDDIPKIHGLEKELQRLLHNVLSNAIKYSYHSIPEVKRVIRIMGRVPYDPGFKRRRFAISFENYGIGVHDDEKVQVLRPGFRGRQAIAEVPIGAGIGLSEAQKIMQLHGGEVKLRSKLLHHQSGRTGPTYLTTVALLFPY